MMNAAARWRVRAIMAWGGWRRRMTVGARALCVVDGAVLLMRHRYVPGLHLPGGAVDPGETALQAATRELKEETGASPLGPGRLLGLYFNTHFTDRDHVAVYVFDAVEQGVAPTANAEIVSSGWYPLADLPLDVTEATRRRLAEHAGAAISPYW